MCAPPARVRCDARAQEEPVRGDEILVGYAVRSARVQHTRCLVNLLRMSMHPTGGFHTHTHTFGTFAVTALHLYAKSSVSNTRTSLCAVTANVPKHTHTHCARNVLICMDNACSTYAKKNVHFKGLVRRTCCVPNVLICMDDACVCTHTCCVPNALICMDDACVLYG